MPLYFSDFHLHSKYSRAVSINMDLEHLHSGAIKKGLHILGGADFSHPKWFSELKSNLVESEHQGLFSLKGKENSEVFFILQNEVATIISTPKGVKKVHHILLAPDFESVSQLNDVLSKKGNLSADGRPIFGQTSPPEIVEICKKVNSQIEIIPAHAWTPWFSIFGSNSGFDSMESGYEDQVKHIFAFETGMSSDPAMNWRISSLDKYLPISNSDAHSAHPYRIGRECSVFEFEKEKLSFKEIMRAMKQKDARNFKFTVEVDPNYGKYHFDGHRNCNFSCPPSETKKLNGICPKCQKKLVIGVQYRVDQLANRESNEKPKNAFPFKTILPLQDLIACVYAKPALSKLVYAETERLTSQFGTEFNLLLFEPEKSLREKIGFKLASAIIANRNGSLKVKAGYDGEYGVLELPPSMILKKNEKDDVSNPKEKAQTGLSEFI